MGAWGAWCEGAWVRAFLLFSLSLPVGVAAAVSVQLAYHSMEDDATYCWVTGLLNAFAAGTLAHVGVEMITRELEASQQGHHQPPEEPCAATPKPPCAASLSALHSQRVRAMLAISLGAAMMCVLAIWA